MNVGQLWSELEADLQSLGKDQWVVRRLNPDSDCDVRLGIDGATQRRTLLIRVLNSAIPATVEYPKARGFELHEASLADSPPTHTTLGVFLVESAFEDIFTTLVEDVVQRLIHVTNDRDAVGELVNRLKVWQRFMERAADGLSAEAQRGLYGELCFLRDYLIPNLGVRQAIVAWVGPSGTPQDFQWQKRACEVKTSVAKQHHKLWIANELQLDTRSVDFLWVYNLSLDARRGSGETLPNTIESIEAAIADDITTCEDFAALLLEAGYHSTHRDKYDATGYTVREAKFFHVREDFPRIVEQNLPIGVGDVRYSVSVAECQPFEVEASEVVQLIGT